MADNKELVELRADGVYMAKLLVRLRNKLVQITDNIENEGDRAYFGSTNDADDLLKLFHSLDDFKWSLVLDRKKGRDLYAEMRKLRIEREASDSRIAALQAEVERLRAQMLDALHLLGRFRTETRSQYQPPELGWKVDEFARRARTALGGNDG